MTNSENLGQQSGIASAYQRVRSNLTLRRETDVMGLTAAVTLLAALTAGSDLTPHTKTSVLLVIWGATFGLAIVHWFALIVAMRLVSDPSVQFSPLELLISQTLMASFVAIVASAFTLILPMNYDRLGARITAALFIGVLVAVETGRTDMSPIRRFLLSVCLAVAGITVAFIKLLVK